MGTRHNSFKGVKGCWLIIFLSSVIMLWGFSTFSTAIAAPKASLSMATDRIGTTFNAIGSAFAKVVSQHSQTTVVVRPFAGPDAWIPALNNGEVELGAVSAFSAWQAYNAVGSYDKPLTDFRLLRSGEGGLKVGFCVLKKSDIKTVEDIKGKRVPTGFGGHIAIMRSVQATLKTGGLDWPDVVQVPVTGAADSIAALGEGRVDVTWASYAMPVVRELDAKTGVRFLPMKEDPKSLEILRSYGFPGMMVVTVKKGSAPGVPEDTPLITYDSYLIAWAGLDDETATAMLNTLWENTTDLFPVHPAMKGFTREASVTAFPVVPYHPAAVKFYKEKGVWNPEADTVRK